MVIGKLSKEDVVKFLKAMKEEEMKDFLEAVIVKEDEDNKQEEVKAEPEKQENVEEEPKEELKETEEEAKEDTEEQPKEEEPMEEPKEEIKEEPKSPNFEELYNGLKENFDALSAKVDGLLVKKEEQPKIKEFGLAENSKDYGKGQKERKSSKQILDELFN